MWKFPDSCERGSCEPVTKDTSSHFSMLECAHVLVAARNGSLFCNRSQLQQPLIPCDNDFNTKVVFKRPDISKGFAFIPGPARVEPELKRKSTLLPCPMAKRPKFSRPEPQTEPEDYTNAGPIEPSSELNMEAESSLLSPPLSPQLGEDDTFKHVLERRIKNRGYPIDYSDDDSFGSDLATHACNCAPVVVPLDPPTIARAIAPVVAPPAVAPAIKRPAKDSAIPARRCISCHIDHTPCWRPSWDPSRGQLCNSCGLRYRKTQIRCSSKACANVPSKLDLAAIRARYPGNSQLRCPKCESILLHD